MDASYRNRLLREAVDDPSKLVVRKKFWKLELWLHYLRRCDDILCSDPAAGLVLTQWAPAYACKLAEHHPGINGSDLLLLAHSYLGGAHRRNDDYAEAERSFLEARKYRDTASQNAYGEHLRRFAYLRICQMDPRCFPAIEDAIAIQKHGNLVTRHELGECLLCRGHAYFAFHEYGRCFDDWTSALNHLEIKQDPKPWYATLHNLAVWAVEYGSDDELRLALNNLKRAQLLLSTFRYRQFAKLKMRWLIALVEFRLGAIHRAEMVFLDIRKALIKKSLVLELGWLSIDLALVYLAQGRTDELRALVRETVAIFRRLEVEPSAQRALDLWVSAEEIDEAFLKRVRTQFSGQAAPIPQGIAA